MLYVLHLSHILHFSFIYFTFEKVNPTKDIRFLPLLMVENNTFDFIISFLMKNYE